MGFISTKIIKIIKSHANDFASNLEKYFPLIFINYLIHFQIH